VFSINAGVALLLGVAVPVFDFGVRRVVVQVGGAVGGAALGTLSRYGTPLSSLSLGVALGLCFC